MEETAKFPGVQKPLPQGDAPSLPAFLNLRILQKRGGWRNRQYGLTFSKPHTVAKRPKVLYLALLNGQKAVKVYTKEICHVTFTPVSL